VGGKGKEGREEMGCGGWRMEGGQRCSKRGLAPRFL